MKFFSALLGKSAKITQQAYPCTIDGVAATIDGDAATIQGAFEEMNNDIYEVVGAPPYAGFPITFDFGIFPFKAGSSPFGNASNIRVGTESIDVGYDSEGIYDTASHDAFVTGEGGGDAFLTKDYDESGNGYDAAQTSESIQPKQISDGSVIFDGNGDHLLASVAKTTTGAFTVFFVLNTDDDGSLSTFDRIFQIGPNTGTAMSAFITNNLSRIQFQVKDGGVNKNSIYQPDYLDSEYHTYIYTYNPNDSHYLWFDGQPVTPISNAAGGSADFQATNDIYIMSREGGSNALDGDLKSFGTCFGCPVLTDEDALSIHDWFNDNGYLP